MSNRNLTTVSSAELQRSFGRYRDAALRTPVSITNHGRETLVLLSATEYRRLKELDRRSLRPWEMSRESIEALLAAEPPAEAATYDHELQPRPKRRRR
jgi:prevent-host-death family protein